MEPTKVSRIVRRMTEARASLIRENPFFGHLSMGLQLACAPCKTACTDGSRLIFDPEFAEQLSDREMQFVILHEILHCVLEHCIRGKSLQWLPYNIACDIVVNSSILDMWGMDSITIAGEEAMHLAPDGKEGRLYNAEEIYYMLICEQGNANEGAFDRHDLWQGIYDKVRLRDDWNGRIRKAVKECGDSAGMPQSIRRIVQALAERVGLDWKQLLHDFIQFDRFDYNFLPPDRRYSDSDFYLPAYNVDEDNGYANHIWVCVDTSGSISEEELACAMAEILDAMAQAGLKGSISFLIVRLRNLYHLKQRRILRKSHQAEGAEPVFRLFSIIYGRNCAGIFPEQFLYLQMVTQNGQRSRMHWRYRYYG
ncbi:MAG: hypothetical protein MR487_00570 [Lachnospiraceae bacterium]|nr:hypothetical protein [Lachnospiraceae bacterium]